MHRGGRVDSLVFTLVLIFVRILTLFFIGALKCGFRSPIGKGGCGGTSRGNFSDIAKH